MAIFRCHKNANFTAISNEVFRDKNLSLKGIGMLCFMLSFSENWHYSINGICALRKESETAITSAINELKEAGYLIVTKQNGKDGHFEYVYDVYDSKQSKLSPSAELPAVENPCMVIPDMETHPLYKEYIDKEYIDKDCNIQTSSYVPNTDTDKETNTYQSSYVRPASRTNRDELEERFERFWSAYPKKVGKGAAHKSFLKIRPSEPLLEKMLRAVEAASVTEQWLKDKGQFIPLPATWLNQERWEDEIEAPKEVKLHGDWANWYVPPEE